MPWEALDVADTFTVERPSSRSQDRCQISSFVEHLSKKNREKWLRPWENVNAINAAFSGQPSVKHLYSLTDLVENEDDFSVPMPMEAELPSEQLFIPGEKCSYCWKSFATKRRSRCKEPYCSQPCQFNHWPKHKFVCASLPPLESPVASSFDPPICAGWTWRQIRTSPTPSPELTAASPTPNRGRPEVPLMATTAGRPATSTSSSGQPDSYRCQ